MKCPYSDRLMPRCEIRQHPHREDVEYCRVCGEWRHLSEIGNDFPRLVLGLIGSAVLVMVFVALINEKPAPQPLEPQYPQSMMQSHVGSFDLS